MIRRNRHLVAFGFVACLLAIALGYSPGPSLAAGALITVSLMALTVLDRLHLQR